MLETAIAAIEDQIEQTPALPAKGSSLRTKDAFVREIALAAGLPPGANMSFALEAVEQAFQPARCAGRRQTFIGRRSSRRSKPLDPQA